MQVEGVGIGALGGLVLELPSTEIKLLLKPLLVNLVDVRAGVVLLMDNDRTLTRATRFHHSVKFR